MIAGTDLYDGNDFFAIASITGTPGAAINLGMTGKAGRVYQLWRSLDLITWVQVGLPTDPLAADGPLQLSDPSSPSPQAFYRIEVSLP